MPAVAVKKTQATASEKRAALEASPRPFRNHYAGLHIGACATAQSAMVAAFRHLVYGEASKAQVVGPDDRDVCRLHWTSMGITAEMPSSTYSRPKAAAPYQRPKLSRVK